MKDAFRVIVGTKEEAALVSYVKEAGTKLNNKDAQENYRRWTILLIEIINQGKSFYNGTNEKEIMNTLNDIDAEAMTNSIISNYFKTGENLEQVKEEVRKYYLRHVKIEEQSINKETSKTYVKATSHKTGTETGFASPLLLAILTASIEISTVAYIILNAMD